MKYGALIWLVWDDDKALQHDGGDVMGFRMKNATVELCWAWAAEGNIEAFKLVDMRKTIDCSHTKEEKENPPNWKVNIADIAFVFLDKVAHAPHNYC